MNIGREREALLRLEDALDWPPGERDTRLSTELEHDPDLLQIVRELVEAATAANASLPTRMPLVPLVEDLPPPERIGPYRLRSLLGAGGMGRVYRADRDDGLFEQAVAIKLVRRSLLAVEVAEQFARERQILARLQHRNIAQLFDGGVTAEGQSYFVMELVDGRSITEDARERSLPLRERLQIFLQVCNAVQHAHANLVVHADLKPSNVIVTPDGTAKLLDFGVARALADAHDLQLRPLGITYDYASPARRAGMAPSTSDDVYSLGVLLGELLDDVKVPADLLAVVGRARGDTVDARYASVGALADELRRWLAGDAVEAYRGDVAYALRKLVGRHRLAASISVGALLLLGVAAVALAILYVDADRARKRAEQSFADAREVARWMLYDVYDRLTALPHTLTLRRDIAASAQTYLDRLARDPSASPAVRIEVAEGLRRLALVQGIPGAAHLAQPKLAEANLENAAALLRDLRPTDGSGMRALELQQARIALARSVLAAFSGLDFSLAGAALDDADQRIAAVLVAAPADADAAALRLQSVVQRAAVLQWQGKYEVAIALSQREIAGSRAIVAAAPSDTEAALRHARLLDVLAESIYYVGRPSDAVAPYSEQLDLLRTLATRSPGDVRRIAGVARGGWALGSTLVELRRYPEAERVLRESVEAARAVLALDPEDMNASRSYDISAGSLATALAGQKRFDEAIPLLEARERSTSARAAAAPGEWGLLRDQLNSLAMLADARADAGQVEAACGGYEQYLAIVAKLRAAGRWSQLDEDSSLPQIVSRRHQLCGGPPPAPAPKQ